MEAEKTEPIRLLDIEHELAGPDKEAALARYDAVLVGLDRRIDASMKEGLAPAEGSGNEGGEHPRKEDFALDRPSGRLSAEGEAERRRSTTKQTKKRKQENGNARRS